MRARWSEEFILSARTSYFIHFQAVFMWVCVSLLIMNWMLLLTLVMGRDLRRILGMLLDHFLRPTLCLRMRLVHPHGLTIRKGALSYAKCDQSSLLCLPPLHLISPSFLFFFFPLYLLDLTFLSVRPLISSPLPRTHPPLGIWFA